MAAPQQTKYAVDGRVCIRCAACATVAPEHFVVRGGPARALRSPENERERNDCRAAAALCPTQAISPQRELIEPAPVAPASPAPAPLFAALLEAAESARWKFAELPWADFDLQAATPGLRAVVREMAYSEQTTFSATGRFMEAFGTNPDFSQWISVWFYEETRHPLALLKWLELAGETTDAEFVTQGRVSAPFMKSLTGTLVTNVISELVAAEAYLGLVRGAPEKLLTALAERICADEARHGASFFTYARRALATAADPDRERLDALKVLHFWVKASQSVSHPVNEAMARIKPLLVAIGAPVFAPPTDRIARVIGCLTGLPIDTPADVPAQLLEYTRRIQGAPGA